MAQYEIKPAAEVEGKAWRGDDGFYVVDASSKQTQFFSTMGEATAFVGGQQDRNATHWNYKPDIRRAT
jgi:hypothetical protein